MPEPAPLDLAPYLNPISPDRPSGEDMRWEDDYLAIEAAREEEEDAKSQGIYKRDRKKADWDKVISLGTKLLRESTKDLQIAAWITEALAVKRSLAGIRDGIRLLLGLQETFWTTAHPSDGDLELREGVYEFLDNDKRLPLMIRNTVLTDFQGLTRYSYLQYRESREIENNLLKDPAKADELLAIYAADGKIRGTDFDSAVEATDATFLQGVVTRLQECSDAVDQLNASIRRPDHYPKNAPTLSKTFAALEEVTKLAKQFLKKKMPEGEPSPEASLHEAEAAAGEGAGQERDDVPDMSAEGVAPSHPARAAAAPARRASGGPISSADDARARIADAAAYLRGADPTDPTPYVTLRALRLGELYRNSSPLDPSSLPRPDSDDREELRNLAVAGDWTALLKGTERVLARQEGGAWLDVYRFAIRALEGLEYHGAARAVAGLLGAALRDYPEWPSTELRDGTPAANGETRTWLEATFPTQVSTPGSATSGYVPPSPSSEELDGSARGATEGIPDDRLPDVWELAQECVRNREPQQAIALMARAVRETRTGRERFLRSLQQAEICLMLNRQAIAAPLLDGLARQVDEFHLDQWEDPGLCARVLGAYYRCLRTQKDERAVAVYRRLCQLDIALALSLDEGPGH